LKTLEFKIYPTKAQAQTIDLWLDNLRWVWNTGLSLKLAGRQNHYHETCSDHPIPQSLALKWAWRKVQSTGKKGKITEKWEKIRLVGSGVVHPKNGYPYCPIRQHRDIENPDKFKFSRKDNAPDFIVDVPSKFRDGVIDNLNKAWKAYSDPKHTAQKPKFKGKRDKLKSLINLNAGGVDKSLNPEKLSNSNNGYVRFPKLGKLYVKGLFKRYNWQEWGAASIVKEPSGYYLHVRVNSLSEELPANDKAVGIDPGLISVITTDHGREVKAPKLYRKQQKRLRRLQRKASRQVKGSNNQKKTYQKIARLHEKIRRSRNAFNHKLSTKIVREYGAVVMEDIQIKNLSRKPKPKKKEDGKGFEQNGAKRKAGLNKSFADSALGDLISKIESKCKATGREFTKVPAHYTSINCSQCGTEIRKSLSQRTHRCTSCGYVDGRDANAAKNILAKGREILERIYRAWAWEVKPASASEIEGQQEAGQPAPSPENGDQLTIHLQELRECGDVNSGSTPKFASKAYRATFSKDATRSSTRPTCETTNLAISAENPAPKSRTGRRSAQLDPKIGSQLSIWDIAEANSIEDAG